MVVQALEIWKMMRGVVRGLCVIRKKEMLKRRWNNKGGW